MSGSTSIEWTEMTWNPVTGCSKVSAGCKNCYAERMAKRLQAMGVPQYRNGFAPTTAPQALKQPYEWKKPRLVFVNSMSDLFHEQVPLAYIQEVFGVMNDTPHVYQILTKRTERMLETSPQLRWTKNIWMGVSVEREDVTFRIDDLAQCGAKKRFLSLEPLIGPVGSLNLDRIDWVIVGGESGPRARPLHREWVDEVKSQCEAKGVPFFFKQWGHARFNDDPNDPTKWKGHPSYAKGGCQLGGEVRRELPVVA